MTKTQHLRGFYGFLSVSGKTVKIEFVRLPAFCVPDIEFTSSVDVSVLQRAIPQVVAFGRRTLHEQCVTSAAFICLDAQSNTIAVTVGRIDADLEVQVRGFTAKGRASRAKRPDHKISFPVAGVRVPMAVLIIMARMNPGSNYNKLTGGRWALPANMLPTGPGTALERQAMIQALQTQMASSRHSSTHFIQHGWGPAIRTLLSDPAYYAGRSRMRINAQAKINPTNLLNNSSLGNAVIELTGDQCVVMAENDIGGAGNAVLAEKHRAALIRVGLQPLEQAIYKEAASIFRKVQDYLDRGMKQDFSNL
jgi:hypothetical protein